MSDVLASPCKKIRTDDVPPVKRKPVEIGGTDSDGEHCDVYQVYNRSRGRLHLYCKAIQKTKAAGCSWKCGAMSAPSHYAEFYKNHHTIELQAKSFSLNFQPCGRCFSMKTLRKYGWDHVVPDKEALMPTVLQDSDEASDDSSSDSDSSHD